MNPLRWHRCPDCGRYDTDRALDTDGYPPLRCCWRVSPEMERIPDPIKKLEAEVSRLSAAHRGVVNNLSRALRERYEALERIAALEAGRESILAKADEAVRSALDDARAWERHAGRMREQRDEARRLAEMLRDHEMARGDHPQTLPWENEA